MKKNIEILMMSLLFALSFTSSAKDPKSVDVIIETGAVKIGGTLVLPENQKISSLVIMSSGSGDQDRDETLEGFKIFKTLADHLASEGIASFRYDDRGIGASTGNFVNSTLEDHALDLEDIMDYFKTVSEYTFTHFILLGHSQGGILAGKVALGNNSVKKVILMGAPAVPLVEVVLYQVRQEYEHLPVSRSLIEAHVSAHNKMMRALEDEKDIDQACGMFKQSLGSILYELSSEKFTDKIKIEQEAKQKTKEFKVIYDLPSLTSYLYHDPSLSYERLEIPVLALFGGLDFQVTIQQNKDRMENALLKSNSNYQFKVFDKANHFFQHAKTGQRSEYGTLDKRFIDGFLEEISTWIIKSK